MIKSEFIQGGRPRSRPNDRLWVDSGHRRCGQQASHFYPPAAEVGTAAATPRSGQEGERGVADARVVPQTPWRIGVALRQDLTLAFAVRRRPPARASVRVLPSASVCRRLCGRAVIGAFSIRVTHPDRTAPSIRWPHAANRRSPPNGVPAVCSPIMKTAIEWWFVDARE